MQQFEFLQNNPMAFAAFVGLIGLIVGSFLNVVIYRLPIMMQREWRKECISYLQLDAAEHQAEDGQEQTFNLLVPLSRCPSCHVPIRPWQNIPVFSYLWLKGRCGNCAEPISLRYPLIEAFTGLLSVMVALKFGFSGQTLYALFLTWALIALSFIDLDHYLLPDSIILPLIWVGLLLGLSGVFADAHSSIIGAAAGYLVLWGVFQAFKLATGKEGMGYGDFKLLALFGAWLGWQYLPLIILLSSLVGAVVGVAMIVFAQHDRSKPIPFGPYLAAAGWLALMWGKQINEFYLNTSGL